MKLINIDQKLIASRPDSSTGNKDFVRATMQAIAVLSIYETTSSTRRKPNKTKRQSLVTWFKNLSFAASFTVVALFIVAAGGVVYAAVEYAPKLIEILSKSESDRGTTEYIVPGYKDCSVDHIPGTELFELNRGASGLPDEEVQKIIQARCEANESEKLISTIWPWQEQSGPPRKGDVLSYVSRDVIGTVKEVSDTEIVQDISTLTGSGLLSRMLGPSSRTYLFAPDEHIRVFFQGAEVSLNEIERGDTVMPVLRYSDTYLVDYNPDVIDETGDSAQYELPLTEHREVGVVGIIKLSLPAEYYQHEKQQNVSEINSCFGNESEQCPEIQSSIWVFPRGNGENSFNPKLMRSENAIFRTIVGTVKSLGDSSLIIESSSGTEYSVTTPTNGIRDYNEIYVLSYLEHGDDATLRVGSAVRVDYYQSDESDPLIVEASQLSHIALLFESNPKKGDPLKQY